MEQHHQEVHSRGQPSKEQQIQAFGRALDALRAEVEADLGPADVAHIERIRTISQRLEMVGRGLLQVSFEPLGFSSGVIALWLHKCLELMEIGHMALHGAYEGISASEALKADKFKWKAPIDEASWRVGHNIRHHQYTNVAGRDPDIDFGPLRLSPRIAYKAAHRLQPFTNLLTWLGFSAVINYHVTEMSREHAEVSPRKQLARRAQRRAFVSKTARYYGREFIVFPLLAGPFFWKVAAGNLLSDIGRDLCAGAIIYCGHVGATDYPVGAKAGSRARWYAMQVESASNVELSHRLSVLCGALDKQIEHHLFPQLPPNRLREIAPRVKALCDAHGVTYRSASWPKSLTKVFAKLRTLAHPGAAI